MPDAYTTSELKPGIIIGGGRFVLLRSIGKGGMGEVFEAEDTLIGRRVAIKVISPELASNPDISRRFRREARAMIAHPHIAAVYDVGKRSDHSLYIVQELLIGKTLRMHLYTQSRLDITEALDILIPILVALAAIHDKNIVHRDIKPENIFLTSPTEGVIVPKLIDFGISKMASSSINITQDGSVLGTAHYLPPEMLRGEPATHLTDIWATGIVLFEMLSGQTPFEGSSLDRLFDDIENAEIPSIHSLAPGLPRETSTLVERALARDPSQRFRSMREMVSTTMSLAEQHFPDLASRHASMVATLGLKGPSVWRSPQVIEIGNDDTMDLTDHTDETLEHMQPEPSLRRPVWPIGRVDGAWYKSGPVALELDKHADAANQALRVNALHDAIDLAEQTIVTYGATGEARGEMRLIQAIAHRWLGTFKDAERCAVEAMQLLPSGGGGWFSAVLHAGVANGYLGRANEVERLTKEVLDLNLREWNAHEVATLCYLSVWLLRSGSTKLARSAFSRVRAMLKRPQAAAEPQVRAAFDLLKAELSLHSGDPTSYLRRVERALKQFVEIGDARNACLLRAYVGNAYMQLGAYLKAKDLLREALVVGEPMKLMFISATRAHLGLTLARLGELDRALAVESTALEECVQQGHRRFEAISRIYLSEILLRREDLPAAEAEVRKALEIASSVSRAISAHARALLASILLRKGEVEDAYHLAKKAMDALEELDGVAEGEALIRLVHVMALEAKGKLNAAAASLAGARQRLLARLDGIADPTLGQCFREDVPEHVRTLHYKLKEG